MQTHGKYSGNQDRNPLSSIPSQNVKGRSPGAGLVSPGRRSEYFSRKFTKHSPHYQGANGMYVDRTERKSYGGHKELDDFLNRMGKSEFSS